MAYITTENLSSGMVVAHKLLDRDRRVLLRAGVALSESHIQALRSLGIAGLEIRSNHHQNAPVPRSVSSCHLRCSTEEGAVSHEKAAPLRDSFTPRANKPVLEALRVTRTASKPLQPKLEPLIAKQTETIVNDLLKGTQIREDSAVAAVIRLCTIRALCTKNRQKTDAKTI